MCPQSAHYDSHDRHARMHDLRVSIECQTIKTGSLSLGVSKTQISSFADRSCHRSRHLCSVHFCNLRFNRTKSSPVADDEVTDQDPSSTEFGLVHDLVSSIEGTRSNGDVQASCAIVMNMPGLIASQFECRMHGISTIPWQGARNYIESSSMRSSSVRWPSTELQAAAKGSPFQAQETQ